MRELMIALKSFVLSEKMPDYVARIQNDGGIAVIGSHQTG
jgi:hypothetical protein